MSENVKTVLIVAAGSVALRIIAAYFPQTYPYLV